MEHKKEDIINVIQDYYHGMVKNNLDFLDICDKKDIDLISSFFLTHIIEDGKVNTEQYIQQFKKFDLLLVDILDSYLGKLSNDMLQKKIQLFLSDIVFPMVNKKDFISPRDILSPELLSININKSFLKKTIHKTLLILLKRMLEQIIFYNKSINVSIFYSSYKELCKVLKTYHDVFLNYYNSLLNKYDSTADYIFPIYNKTDNNVYFSKVLYNKEKSKAGSEADNIKRVKEQLNDIYNNNIKHVYDKEDIKKLENLLNNSKINNLIARKELKLSPGFNNVIKNLLNDNNTEEEKKEYFNEIFDLSNEKELTKEELYQMYKNEPNKEGFIKYIVDKTIHGNIPKKNEDSSELKVVSLIDKIFDKILHENYDHNSLNLQDEDAKFLLMLETLNSIKTSTMGNSSNITVNLFKDVDRTKVNDDEIKFN